MLSDNLGEKKNFRKKACIFACGLQCNRKTWSCIFVAGFCFVYKDATRKTKWFFCIRNISKTKQSLAENLRDIVKLT